MAVVNVSAGEPEPSAWTGRGTPARCGRCIQQRRAALCSAVDQMQMIGEQRQDVSDLRMDQVHPTGRRLPSESAETQSHQQAHGRIRLGHVGQTRASYQLHGNAKSKRAAQTAVACPFGRDAPIGDMKVTSGRSVPC